LVKNFDVEMSKTFAIYDARVAAAIHALQLISGEMISVFPHVESRNKTIKDFQRAQKGTAKLYAVSGAEAYKQYLELLRSVSDKRSLPSLDICEMCLFTYAEDLIKEVAC